MGWYLLTHRHAPEKCGVAYAAFKGQATPLRHAATWSSCAAGGHEIWWVVQAPSEEEALALLPHYVARRCAIALISSVVIP